MLININAKVLSVFLYFVLPWFRHQVSLRDCGPCPSFWKQEGNKDIETWSKIHFLVETLSVIPSSFTILFLTWLWHSLVSKKVYWIGSQKSGGFAPTLTFPSSLTTWQVPSPSGLWEVSSSESQGSRRMWSHQRSDSNFWWFYPLLLLLRK